MNKVNTILCASDWANTGFGDCPVHMAFEGMIQVPKDAVFTEAQISDLVAHINTKIKADNKLQRFYPFPAFIKLEPSGGDPNKVELDNGGSVTTWENAYLFTAEFYEAGIPLNNALRSRNGQDIYFIAFGKGFAFGEKVNGKYKGIKGSNFFANGQKPGAFKAKSEYSFSFNVDAKSLNERLWFVKAEGIDEIQGLKSLELKPATDPALSVSGLLVCDLLLKGYGTDYLESYGAAIAGLTFTCKNTETGGSITVTGVAIGTSGKLEIDLDSADTDYPVAGKSLTVYGPTVTALEGAGVLSAEIVPLTVVR